MFLNFIKYFNTVAVTLFRKSSLLLSNKIYLQLLYWLKFGGYLNLENPKTFNEKLNWLKIHDKNTLYTHLANKVSVKQFVSELIGKEYVVPTFGVWDSVEEVNFQSLPNSFVVKANHDSSGAVIVRDKNTFDKHKLDKYKVLLKRNYYYYLREWPYKNIKPQLFAEQLLNDGTQTGKEITLQDYKFMCFNGIPRFMYITVKDKEIYENFFDMQFKPMHINHGFPRRSSEPIKPDGFEKMIELARKLAKASQTAFVRVDFFNVNGKIYFSEFTFYDWGGLRPFASYEQDLELGMLINLDLIIG